MKKPMAMYGVPGFLTALEPRDGTTEWQEQSWVSEARDVSKEYGSKRVMTVSVCFDNDCRNGHNLFAITAEIRRPGASDLDDCGCLHDDIARYFPELEPLIKWHLFDSTGPMHYVANTTYHASDRDYDGLLKGEKRQIRNGRTGLPCWVLEQDDDLPKNVDSETQPTETTIARYVPWCRVGEGKERDLDAARSCAVWPDATDEQLCAPKAELEAALLARLPALLAEFRAAMEGAGLLWEP